MRKPAGKENNRNVMLRLFWWRRGELRHNGRCLTGDIDLQAGRSARATARAKASAAPPPNPRAGLSSRFRRWLSICFPLCSGSENARSLPCRLHKNPKDTDFAVSFGFWWSVTTENRIKTLNCTILFRVDFG